MKIRSILEKFLKQSTNKAIIIGGLFVLLLTVSLSGVAIGSYIQPMETKTHLTGQIAGESVKLSPSPTETANKRKSLITPTSTAQENNHNTVPTPNTVGSNNQSSLPVNSTVFVPVVTNTPNNTSVVPLPTPYTQTALVVPSQVVVESQECIDLKSQYRSLSNEFANIPENTAQQTAGHDVNSNQLQRMIAQKQTDTYGKLSDVQSQLISKGCTF